MPVGVTKAKSPKGTLTKRKHLTGTFMQHLHQGNKQQTRCTCQYKSVGAATSDSRDESSRKRLNKARLGEAVRRGIQTRRDAVTALAFRIAAPNEQFA